MKYDSWRKNGMVGFRCTADNGTESYIYLNPSYDDGDRDANVFLYVGETGDPALDNPVTFVEPSRSAG